MQVTPAQFSSSVTYVALEAGNTFIQQWAWGGGEREQAADQIQKAILYPREFTGCFRV